MGASGMDMKDASIMWCRNRTPGSGWRRSGETGRGTMRCCTGWLKWDGIPSWYGNANWSRLSGRKLWNPWLLRWTISSWKIIISGDMNCRKKNRQWWRSRNQGIGINTLLIQKSPDELRWGEVSSGDSLFLFLYLAKVPLHRLCETSRVSYRSFLLWISSPCLHLLAQIHNKNLR